MNNINKIKIAAVFTVLTFACNQSTTIVWANVPTKENYKLAYLNLNWWKKFNDPILENYLIEAYNNNHDLKIASAKIRQGQQVVKQSLGKEMPQIQLLGSLNRTMRSSDIQYGDVLIPEYSQSNFLLPLTMNYELDIWGKNRLKTKSAQKQLDILKQSERATYISLTSAFASDYYNLVRIDKMLEYQNKILKIQQCISEMTEAKYKGGLTSVAAVIQERKNLTVAQDEKNTLELDRDVLTSQLKTLLAGPQDESLNRISFDKISVMEIPAQINTVIVQNRPDFIVSQEYLQKIGIDVKVAKKELLPSFILTGEMGFNSYEWGNIFNSKSFLSNVGIIPYWSAFTGGQKIAYFRFKKYEYEEATQKYEKTVLTSIQELNDSLLIAKTASKNYKSSVERLNLEDINYELISKEYKIGGTSNLQRLKAQEVLLASEKNEVSNKINCIISAIGLYKAVGGQDISQFKDEKL